MKKVEADLVTANSKLEANKLRQKVASEEKEENDSAYEAMNRFVIKVIFLFIDINFSNA